jgi:hypothetical protein
VPEKGRGELMLFKDEFFSALGAWQRGWNEDQNRRLVLATELKSEVESIPIDFRRVESPCYRKRFLNKEDLFEIVMANEKPEGLTSWTTDKSVAELFKGMVMPDAVTAAIFKCEPSENETLLNVPKLWQCDDFQAAAASYKERSGEYADALFHFKAKQKEVILEVPLRGDDIVHLVGVSSPFDELCDYAGIPQEGRDELCIKLMDQGTYCGEPMYTPEASSQLVIRNTIRRMVVKLEEWKREIEAGT